MPYRTRRFRGSLGFLAGLRLVINTAQRFVYPFLPAIGRGLGVSLEQAGLLVSARWAAGLGTPLLVAAAGRGEVRRRLIALGLTLFTLGAAVTAATNVYVGAFAGFVLMGIAKPLFDVAAQAYIADRVPYRSRARYLGMFELTWAGSLLVGAPVAGWLIDSAGWQAPFWALAALGGVGIALVAVLLDADPAAARPSRAPLGWDRAAVAFLGIVALFSGAAEVMFVVMGAWLEDAFGLSLLGLGGLATLVALAELGGEGSTVGFADRIGKRTAVAAGVAISAVGFAAMAVFESRLVPGIGAMMVAFFGFELAIVSSIPLASEVRPQARARFLAWMIVAMALGRTLGAALGPLLFTEYGLAGNTIVAAGANVLALVALLAWVRDVAPADGGGARPAAR